MNYRLTSQASRAIMRSEQWKLLQQMANADPQSESLFHYWCDEQWRADLHALRDFGREATTLDWQSFWGNLTRSLLQRSDLRYESTRERIVELVKEVTSTSHVEGTVGSLVSPDSIVRELSRAALLTHLEGIVQTFPALAEQSMTVQAMNDLTARRTVIGLAGFRKDKSVMTLTDAAREQFSEEEVIAAYRDLKEKGGLELSQFITELEQIVVQL